MDPEAIVWLIFVAIWFIGSIVKQIKNVAEQRPGQSQEEDPARARERPQPARQPADDDPMIKLLRQLGGEVEVRPQEPPRQSRPALQPPRPQLPRSQPPRLQPATTTARSASRPKVAKMASIPEMDLPPLPETGQAVRTGSSGGSSAMARSLRRQLRRPSSARKAILLQEILGKPVALQGSRSR